MNKKIKKIITISTTFALTSFAAAIAAACTNKEPKPSVREIDKTKFTNSSDKNNNQHEPNTATDSTTKPDSQNNSNKETEDKTNSNAQEENKNSQDNSVSNESKESESVQNQPDENQELSVVSIEYTKISDDEVDAKITLNRELGVDEHNSLSVKLTEVVTDAETDTFRAYKNANDKNTPFVRINFFMLEPNKEYTIADFIFKNKNITKPTTNLTFRTTNSQASNLENDSTTTPTTEPKNEPNPTETDSSSTNKPQPKNDSTPVNENPTTENQSNPNEELSVVSIEYMNVYEDEVEAKITFNRIFTNQDYDNLVVKLTEVVTEAETDTFRVVRNTRYANTNFALLIFHSLEANKEYTIADFVYKNNIINKPTTNLTFRTTNPQSGDSSSSDSENATPPATATENANADSQPNNTESTESRGDA